MQAARLTSSGNETQFNLGNKETHMASNVIRPTLAVPSSSNATDTFTMVASSVHIDSTILEEHFNDLPEDLSVFVPNDITISILDASLSIEPVPAPVSLPVSPGLTIIVPRRMGISNIHSHDVHPEGEYQKSKKSEQLSESQESTSSSCSRPEAEINGK
nr:hypothetical protein CFP56_19738 [Quercus suber]